ncbi:MAG: PTS sugar transporter subunit IIB [Solobacterium sp.]|nr:PTS sugar transporter subunit IIB [Solobacterium sp.]
MYIALVCCVAGMGSSMLLKIRADKVVADNQFPIQLVHGDMEALNQFEGDVVITMKNLEQELLDRGFEVIGIQNVGDAEEMKTKIEAFLAQKEKE